MELDHQAFSKHLPSMFTQSQKNFDGTEYYLAQQSVLNGLHNIQNSVFLVLSAASIEKTKVLKEEIQPIIAMDRLFVLLNTTDNYAANVLTR